MAVYTDLTQHDIENICQQYQLGTLLSFQGIEGGVENSNYLIHCKTDEIPLDYVLTLFEELTLPELPFYINLLAKADEFGLDVAAALKDKNNNSIFECKNKPAIVCPKLAGSHPTSASIQHCKAIGHFLGKFHSLPNANDSKHQGIRSFDWLELLLIKSLPLLSDQDQQAVRHCYQEFCALEAHNLPRGLIHADLFRDNALFIDNELTGVLDFYNASEMYLLFDIAVVINDWCRDEQEVNPEKLTALLDTYSQHRQLTLQEQNNLALMIKFAAMRFWLSRLLEQKKADTKTLGIKKAPDEYRALFATAL